MYHASEIAFWCTGFIMSDDFPQVCLPNEYIVVICKLLYCSSVKISVATSKYVTALTFSILE